MELDHPCHGCLFFKKTYMIATVKVWCNLYKCRAKVKCLDYRERKFNADQQPNQGQVSGA